MARVFFDRQTNKFSGLPDSYLQQLRDVYSDIDVDAELNRMGLWLLSSKGAKRVGNLGFILKWLRKATPEAKEKPVQTALQPWIDEYLEGLWKGREHLLQLNRKS